MNSIGTVFTPLSRNNRGIFASILPFLSTEHTDSVEYTVTETVSIRVLAVVLTGMGQDGKEGCKKVLEAGGRTLVQDENTSVVWGMPGAVATAGFADQILPLDQIANEISRHVVTHSAQEKR